MTFPKILKYEDINGYIHTIARQLMDDDIHVFAALYSVAGYIESATLAAALSAALDEREALLGACEKAISYLGAERDHIRVGEYEEVTTALLAALALAERREEK